MKKLSILLITLSLVATAAAQTELPVDTLDYDNMFTELDNLVVTARKQLIKVEADKVSYDVASDPDSKSSTLLEMLRRVPKVTVDGQDNILVNGQSNFKIYVDGKPNAMLSTNPSQLLKALPATMVERFEVVTTPGAAYDAEGVGGVLNIVMKKAGTANGYAASASLMANLQGVFGNINATVRRSKFSLTGNLSASDMASPDMNMLVERRSFAADNLLRNSSTMKNHFSNYRLSLQGDYNISDKDLLSLSASANRMNMRSDMDAHVTTGNLAATSIFSDYLLSSRTRTRNTGIEASADYTHTFAPDHTLELAYNFSTTPQRLAGTNNYYPSVPTNSQFPLPDDYTSLDRTNMTEHIARLDYNNTFGSHHKLTAGGKMTWRHSKSTSSMLDYLHDAQIAAAYTSYKYILGPLSLNPGLRYEHTLFKVRYNSGDGENFNTHFNNLVPSLSAAYTLSPTQTLTAAYNMRISRPGISYLNPYVNNQNPLYVTYGNPNLSPEKSNKINVDYSAMIHGLMLNASAEYNFSSDGIATYISNRDGITYTTYSNSLHSRSAVLSIFLNWSPFSKTNFILNSMTSWVSLQSPSIGARHNGWRQTIFFGAQQRLPWNLRLSANIFAMNPDITLQGRGASIFFHNLSLARPFLHDRLNVSLTAQCPFYGKMTMRMAEHGLNPDGGQFSNNTRIKMDFRNVVLSLTYTLGDMNASQRKTKIDDSDLMNTSSGGGVNVSMPGSMPQ